MKKKDRALIANLRRRVEHLEQHDIRDLSTRVYSVEEKLDRTGSVLAPTVTVYPAADRTTCGAVIVVDPDGGFVCSRPRGHEGDHA